MHCQDAAGDEFSVLPDGKVPRLDPHQIVKGELQYQTSLCTNLDKDHRAGVTLRSPDITFRNLSQSGRRASADLDTDKTEMSVYRPGVILIKTLEGFRLRLGICSRIF